MSFYYWQPAPTWKLLPFLANPGNPAVSPTQRETGTHYTNKTVEMGQGKGVEQEQTVVPDGRSSATSSYSSNKASYFAINQNIKKNIGNIFSQTCPILTTCSSRESKVSLV